MAYLDSEAELAGVIGQEICNVTARHGAQGATRQQSAGLGGATDLANQVPKPAATGYVASYSRDQESQAYQLGAENLARNR